MSVIKIASRTLCQLDSNICFVFFVESLNHTTYNNYSWNQTKTLTLEIRKVLGFKNICCLKIELKIEFNQVFVLRVDLIVFV